jgi:hypothetical protein
MSGARSLKLPERAEAFFVVARELGVVDLRESSDGSSIFITIAHGSSEDLTDAVRVLARLHWPRREILLVVRSAGAKP